MNSSNSIDFTVRHALALIQKRRYLAVAVALVVMSGFTWGGFVLPKTYEASSIVFIERSSIMDPLIKGVGVSNSLDERLKNLKESMTSRNIIDRVMKRLDRDIKAENTRQYEAFIENVRASLKITVKSGSREPNLFTISFHGNDPKTARDIVNTLVSEYIEESMRYQKSDTYGAYDFIKNQLLEYKGKLEGSDKAIREFRQRNPHMIPQNETIALGRMENYQSAAIEAEIKLKELLRKRDSLEKQLSGEKELTVAFVTKEGSPATNLGALQNKLVLLLTKYTDNYPEVIKVKGEIEELKKVIAQEKNSPRESASTETSTMNPIYQKLREELANTGGEIESLKARALELSRQQQKVQSELGRLPAEQEEWSKLQRDRNVYQKIYDDLSQKLEFANVSKDLGISNNTQTFRVVDPAILPLLPENPNTVVMILLGIIAGIAAGTGAVLGLEYLLHSFRDESAIEDTLKLPVLASVPRMVTKADVVRSKRLDWRIFTAAGVYTFIIILVLVEEFLNRYMGIRIIN